VPSRAGTFLTGK